VLVSLDSGCILDLTSRSLQSAERTNKSFRKKVWRGTLVVPAQRGVLVTPAESG